MHAIDRPLGLSGSVGEVVRWKYRRPLGLRAIIILFLLNRDFLLYLPHLNIIAMNPKVEEFIQKQKEKQKREREKHLIKLGLAEGEKQYTPFRSEKDAFDFGYTLKDEKGYYRLAKAKAIDITDEEYEAICQFSPNPSSKERQNIDFCNNVVNTLDKLRKMIKFFVVLTIIEIICGIIVAIICVF